MKFWLFLVCAAYLTSACSSNQKEKLVASVYDLQLTEQELKSEIIKQNALQDSSKFADIYINNWIKEHVVVHFAQQTELEELDQINTKVENYRNQLLVHYFQNKLIAERLDTVVTHEEIKSYYQSHKPDFQLKDYLVKVLYIKVSEDAPDLEKLSKWYRLNDSEDEESIIQYAGLYATNFYFDKINWIYFDEITKEIPLTDINKDRFITQKSDIKFSENNYYYFLNILDYKLKNSASPLEFEKENIKARILNKRILALRNTIEIELIQKAENENAIKKY